MKLLYKSLAYFHAKVAVFLITDKLTLPKVLSELDKSGQVLAALKADKGLHHGKSGYITTVFSPTGHKQEAILLLCIGHKDKITESTLQAAGGVLAAKLNAMKCTAVDLCVQLPEIIKYSEAEVAACLTEGIKLRNYVFDKYYVTKKLDHELSLKETNVLSTEPQSIQNICSEREIIAENTIFTRELVAEPPNILYPDSFAKRCSELTALGLKIKILHPKQMHELGMGALLGVAQGSINEARLVVMEWHGLDANSSPLAFVGKGVTFDTGGINLKSTASHIVDMKYDMGGAAVVTGLMRALAMRKAKINAIGVLGLVENMISGTAQRPSDVVESMSGQTIEVDNTDAEGRLVLADALWYTQQEYKPRLIIDLATLTGAITIALGDLYAGLFSNNDTLAEQLIAAGKKSGELLWRLPLAEYYDKQINSEIADVKNTGQQNRGGGSITAAQFLQRFIKDHTWAHLDIAGVTWTKFGSDICPKGATGFGVRLLNNLIHDYYEAH